MYTERGGRMGEAESAAEEECRELQEQEVESLRLIFPEDGDRDASPIGQDYGSSDCGGTRILACVKTKEGGWTLRLAVEATLPSAIDVVVEEEEVEAARARAGPPLRSVKYLPPIQLQLHLGPSYPLHAAPTFTLWAPWLDAAKGAWIEAEMGRMWKDVFQGGPVVFSWVEWLQHEMGEGLLALEEGGGVGGGDDDTLLPRLVLRGLPPPPRSIAAAAKVEEEVEGAAAAAAEGEEAGPHQDERALGDRDNVWGPRLMQTLAHTYARESEAFARASHRCFICFDEKGGREFFVLRCGHFWCRECLGEMARTHVRDGDVGLLVCPFPECGEELAWEVLKELLDAEAFARWEQLLLSKTLDGMEDLAYCPRCQTPCIIDGTLGECPQCHFVFCTRCKEAYHGDGGPSSCYTGEARLKQVEAEIQRIMDKGGQLTATQNEKLEKLRRAAEESLSRRVVEKGTRACPKCAMRVQKTEGCNKMRCRCGVLWCWSCGRDITEESYAHFKEGASNCGLWEREALIAWQRQMLQMEAHRGIQGEMVRLVNWGGGEDGGWRRGRRRGARGDDGIRIVRCGRCGGQHVKMNGNNHVRCAACTAQFCALCGAANFRKAKEHFGVGPGKCPQHS